MDFFEGGRFSEWIALSSNPTRGLEIVAIEANGISEEEPRKQTIMKRASLNSLLTTIAAYCPDGLCIYL